MPEQLSDKAQWIEIQNGNKIMYEAVFRKYYQMLCAFGFSKLKDAIEAEEIVQDVFVKLWDKRSDLQIENLKSYLFSTVNNTIINQFKHQEVRRAHATEMKAVQSDSFEDQTTEFNELQLKLTGLIAEMPEARQRVFKLVKIEGKKYKEVAEELGISIKTVENQMGSALKYLRENLKDFYVLLPLLLEMLING